jgi:hypothetical protein
MSLQVVVLVLTLIKFYKEFYKHKEFIEFHKKEATLKNSLKIVHHDFQEIKHDNE